MLDSWVGTLRRVWRAIAFNAFGMGLNVAFWVVVQNPLFGVFVGWHLGLIASAIQVDRIFFAEVYDRIQRWERAAHDAR